MAKLSMMTVQCPHCRNQLKVSAALGGNSIACPKCSKTFAVPPAPPDTDAPAPAAKSAPAPESGASKADKGHPVTCSNCNAALNVARDKVDRFGVCPRCKQRVRFVNALSATDEFTLSKTDGNLLGKEVFLAQGEDVRSFKAMRELTEASKASYPAAMLKTVAYPFNQLGALIVFVIGIPVSILVMEMIGKSVLSGYAERSGGEGGMVVYAVSAVTLLVPLALASFFCSFLLGVVRNSAKGSNASPVVQGAAHRANLSALCAWMAMYFGLAILIGYRSGLASGTAFRFSAPSLLFFLIGGFLAPMGLLCTATVSISGGLNLPRVFSAIGATIKGYFGCLLTILFGAGVYLLLVLALLRFADKSQSAAMTNVWSFLAYLCLPMPLVVAARAVGVFANYHEKKLPFEMGFFADAKAGALPSLLAAVGVFFLFLPIGEAASRYLKEAGTVKVCVNQLIEIGDTLAPRSGTSAVVRAPVSDLKELGERIGEARMRCPLTREQLGSNPNVEELQKPPFYVVVPQPGGREANANWIMVYEKASVYPDADQSYGGKVNVLVRGLTAGDKGVFKLRLSDVKELVGILGELRAAAGDSARELELSRKYELLFGSAMSRSMFN